MPDFIPKLNAGYPWQQSIPEVVGNIPKLSETPTAASNNAITKPYTNGGLNAGQITALASGAMGMFADYTQSMYQSRALKAQAASYEAKMPLNYAAYRQNVNYMAEENLYAARNIISQYSSLEGTQMTAMGASGFDISSGDQRIIQDTKQKMADELYLANRTAYLQSFELWRNTEMENARLKAAAAMARNQAKYTRRMGRIGLIANALGTAANVYSAGSYGRTGDIGVKGERV